MMISGFDAGLYNMADWWITCVYKIVYIDIDTTSTKLKYYKSNIYKIDGKLWQITISKPNCRYFRSLHNLLRIRSHPLISVLFTLTLELFYPMQIGLLGNKPFYKIKLFLFSSLLLWHGLLVICIIELLITELTFLRRIVVYVGHLFSYLLSRILGLYLKLVSLLSWHSNLAICYQYCWLPFYVHVWNRKI